MFNWNKLIAVGMYEAMAKLKEMKTTLSMIAEKLFKVVCSIAVFKMSIIWKRRLSDVQYKAILFWSTSFYAGQLSDQILNCFEHNENCSK